MSAYAKEVADRLSNQLRSITNDATEARMKQLQKKIDDAALASIKSFLVDLDRLVGTNVGAPAPLRTAPAPHNVNKSLSPGWLKRKKKLGIKGNKFYYGEKSKKGFGLKQVVSRMKNSRDQIAPKMYAGLGRMEFHFDPTPLKKGFEVKDVSPKTGKPLIEPAFYQKLKNDTYKRVKASAAVRRGGVKLAPALKGAGVFSVVPIHSKNGDVSYYLQGGQNVKIKLARAIQAGFVTGGVNMSLFGYYATRIGYGTSSDPMLQAWQEGRFGRDYFALPYMRGDNSYTIGAQVSMLDQLHNRRFLGALANVYFAPPLGNGNGIISGGKAYQKVMGVISSETTKRRTAR